MFPLFDVWSTISSFVSQNLRTIWLNLASSNSRERIFGSSNRAAGAWLQLSSITVSVRKVETHFFQLLKSPHSDGLIETAAALLCWFDIVFVFCSWFGKSDFVIFLLRNSSNDLLDVGKNWFGDGVSPLNIFIFALTKGGCNELYEAFCPFGKTLSNVTPGSCFGSVTTWGGGGGRCVVGITEGDIEWGCAFLKDCWGACCGLNENQIQMDFEVVLTSFVI